MKKRILIITITVLVMVTMLVPELVLATNTENISEDIASAQAAGTAWLIKVTTETNFDIPGWAGSKLSFLEAFYDLDGKINAYMFAIISNKDIVGHVLVGNTAYGNPIFEAGAAPPPSIPTSDEVNKAIGELDIKCDRVVNKPTKLLCLGIDSLFAVYDVDKIEIAVNLVYKDAILYSDLKPMISPGEYKARQKAIADSKPVQIKGDSGSYSIYLLYWNGTYRGWCGPCSGVSIGVYYRDYWYFDNFDQSEEDMYDYLKDFMNTTSGITWPWEYGHGFEEYAEQCGYYNFGDYSWDTNITDSDYWVIADYIDVEMPLGIVRAPLFDPDEWHWRAIKGYWYSDSDDSSTWDICCTNSQTSDSWEMCDWICFESGCYCNTVSIEGDWGG